MDVGSITLHGRERRALLDRLGRKLAWARPVLPQPGDPAPFPARPLRLKGVATGMTS